MRQDSPTGTGRDLSIKGVLHESRRRRTHRGGEPALGPVDWLPYVAPRPRFDWLICGGESGPHARPFDIAWARSARDHCAVRLAFFMKQLGQDWAREGRALARATWEYVRDSDYPEATGPWLEWDRHGADPALWPDDLRVQQFPAPRTPGQIREEAKR